ncbi:hypothetical protein N7490_007590 [Penicillium lividum]|nr:hypothetical protein N7490_007590 [Penicillium lividum]
MSFDRVLPAPAGLHYDNTQVRSSDLLDHKIMSDLPKSHGPLVYRPDSFKYADLRHDIPHAHHQMTVLNQEKVPGPRPDQNDPMMPMANAHSNLMTREPGPVVSTKEVSRSSSSSGSASPVRSAKERDTFCLCQPDPKVPRPRNAFILYRQHYQATVVAHNPGMANPDISKIIGVQWRNLSEEEKSKWKTLAEEEKIRHNQQYPGYRYQPRRSGRDGGARGSGSGISNNPSGGTHCTRCGGRFMHPPSPMTPFTPTTVSTEYRSSGLSASIAQKTVMTARSSHGRERDEPKLIKIEALESSSRSRHGEEIGERSPDNKRRRVSHTRMIAHRDRSPESPYSTAPYSARPDMQPRNMLPMLQPQRQYSSVQGQSHPDQSLKLPPLQTGTPVMTPLNPNFSTEPSVEATVMTIPFLNKIKVLAKISPPLVPSFRESSPQIRGPVIAVDGHDPELVQVAVDYLQRLLRKEPKYHVRVFGGPDIKPQRESSSEGGPMSDATIDYLDTISAWHRISDEVVSFVKSISTAMSVDSRSSPEEESNKLSLSPKSLIPTTASMYIHSPAQSSDNSSDASVSPSTPGSPCTIPIALVPRYQITTADAFACSIPIHDSYGPLDHWQWMASLWRACVGPDITVYIRECNREELDRAGGNAVEVRLQDARTIVLRKVAGSSRELEKALKRVGFEIEDFLTQ